MQSIHAIVAFLHFTSASSIHAPSATLQHWERKFAAMRRDYIDQHCKTKRFSNICVPKCFKVTELSVEDWYETKERSFKKLEIDKQNDNSDIDKLHDYYFLELPNRFIILSMSFLKCNYFFKNHACHDVDENNSESTAVYHSLLNAVIQGPVTAVLGRVRFAICRVELIK